MILGGRPRGIARAPHPGRRGRRGRALRSCSPPGENGAAANELTLEVNVVHVTNGCEGCAVCATNARPQDVPWSQHAIGCPVRSAILRAVNTAPAGEYASALSIPRAA